MSDLLLEGAAERWGAVRFCSHCGDPTAPLEGTAHFRCPAGHEDYVNPAPCVGVAIVRDGQVLLARRGQEPKKDEWDLLGGFVDPGEIVTEAARREVEEESGLQIRDLRRVHQAPGEYRPGEPTLNFVYAAEADGEPEARDDVAEVRWFPLDEVPPLAWPHEEEAVRRLAR